MGSSTNIARDNARVGVQAGQILGPVTVHPGAASVIPLADATTELRALLKLAQGRGDVDDSTFRAAEQEISAIEGSLPPVSGHDRERTLLSLKRLRGLLLDVADLASRITAIITAVQRSS